MINLVLIAVTVLVSLAGFQQDNLIRQAIYSPYAVKNQREWWRMITSGFIHADIGHLAFNMLTLYFFGRNLESAFHEIYGTPLVYPLYYLSALIVSALPAFFKHRDNRYYQALGASGAVSAVLFSTILLDPWQTLYLQFFIPVPAILFAIGYLAYSRYMARRGQDNIGHDAHLWGSLYGLVFPLLTKPFLFPYFLERLKSPGFLN